MSQERQEELASLYAFDLLEGAEKDRFESALARDDALRALVRACRETGAALAHTAPVVPAPAGLRDRVLASVETRTHPAGSDVVPPPASTWRFVPWAIAASLALTSIWLGQRYAATRAEVATLRSRQELAEIAGQSALQQLEAERILSQRRIEDADRQLTVVGRDLGTARGELTERDRQLADARHQLAERERLASDAQSQLAAVRIQLAERERQLAGFGERINALAGSATENSRLLAEARQRVVRLTEELTAQGDLAQLKITALVSMLKNLPQAQAIAVWDPRKQEGILDVQKLPALAANEDYQLWVVDPQYPIPVDGGVFTVEPASGSTRIKFSAKQPINAINAFAVTRERKGGVPKAEGPCVLLGK